MTDARQPAPTLRTTVGLPPPIEPPPATSLLGQWRRVGGPLLVLRVLGQGAEFGAFVVLARRLGAASFGRLAVAFLICRYAGLVADWGASVRGARDVVLTGDTHGLGGLVRLRTGISLSLTAAYLVTAFATGNGALAPLGVAIASRGMSRDWIALGQHRGHHAGLPAIVQGLTMLAAALAVHSEAGGATAVALGYSAAGLLSIAINRLGDTAGPGSVSLNGWMLVAVLADQVTASTDTVLLAALRDTREAGIYAAMYRIPGAWITVIGLSVVGLVPVTSRALRDRPETLARLRRQSVRVGAIGAAVVVATVPVAWILVPLLFGTAYESGRTALALLLLATGVSAMAAPLHPLYIALERDRALAAISLSAAGLNLVGNLLVIPQWGMEGAAATTLCAQTLLLFVLWRAIARAAGARGGTAADAD